MKIITSKICSHQELLGYKNIKGHLYKLPIFRDCKKRVVALIFVKDSVVSGYCERHAAPLIKNKKNMVLEIPNA